MRGLLPFLLVTAAAPAAQDPQPAARPSILLLLADDLHAAALGAAGNARARTPHLDRLFARGLTLRNAYCMDSRHGAVCVPSRAMLLSGRALPAVRDDLAGATTLPECLRAAGYATFLCGKWHNGRQALVRAFPDARAVFVGGMCDHHAVPLVDVEAGELVHERTGDGHSSALFADAAVAFLSGLGDDPRPFFAMVAFTAPHDPRDPPADLRPQGDAELPPLPPAYRGQHGLDLGPPTMTVRDEQLLPWPRPPLLLRWQIAEYQALVDDLDRQVGRTLDALARSGRAADTVVVFTSDHGLALGNHGLLGKQSLYEHSMRVPMVIAGPGIPRGTVSDDLVYLLDLCPTLCAVAAAEPPEGVDGRDLTPRIAGEAGWQGREHLVTMYANQQRAVRDRRFKLVRLPGIDRTLLFDLEADPHELCDLAADDGHRATRERLEGALREGLAALGDELPWTTDELRPATVDLSGHARKPDRWQPEWIRDKYFR